MDTLSVKTAGNWTSSPFYWIFQKKQTSAPCLLNIIDLALQKELVDGQVNYLKAMTVGANIHSCIIAL